jgi:hypothetical protein
MVSRQPSLRTEDLLQWRALRTAHILKAFDVWQAPMGADLSFDLSVYPRQG